LPVQEFTGAAEIAFRQRFLREVHFGGVELAASRNGFRFGALALAVDAKRGEGRAD